MRELDDIFLGRIKTLASNPLTIEEGCRARRPRDRRGPHPGRRGAEARHARDDLADEEGLGRRRRRRRPGRLHRDDARRRPTRIPIYTVDGVIHYCVANMPGAVPRTSTFALTNATLRYALELANKGLKKAVQVNPHLAEGVNTYDGKLTYRAVAEAQGRPLHASRTGPGLEPCRETPEPPSPRCVWREQRPLVRAGKSPAAGWREGS